MFKEMYSCLKCNRSYFELFEFVNYIGIYVVEMLFKFI